MDAGHFYLHPTSLYRSRLRPNKAEDKLSPRLKDTAEVKASDSTVHIGKAMVDNKGWRKKIGGKPKELPPVKSWCDDTAAATPTEITSDSTERRRHGWRKTIATSRPTTPMTLAAPTSTPEDAEDAKSERSDETTPRRESKPKLSRYTSLFAALKDESTVPIFSEPWSVEGIPYQEDPWSYVDPIVIMESIHSHMCKNYMVPIPLEYTSGLFQIFDDYRKLRSHKDLLEARERDALQQSRRVTAQWTQSEEMYESEIHRLELLIARGTAGMTGLMKARQGTLIGRGHQHRKSLSTQCIHPRYQYMSSTEADEEIRTRSRKVLLHRPTSPSARMIALSRQLGNADQSDLPVGTPPDTKRGSALFRKAKSELNLIDMHNACASRSIAGEAPLNQSEDEDHENIVKADQVAKDAVEYDALIALKELGVLVARRNGLDGTNFVKGLMALLTSADTVKAITQPSESTIHSQSPLNNQNTNDAGGNEAKRSPPRELRSLSERASEQERHRHFSFEFGDDQFQEQETEIRSYCSLSQTDSTDSEVQSSTDVRLSGESSRINNGNTTPQQPLSSAEFPRLPATMIPSPIQTVGRVRRENSMSSLQSTFIQSVQDGRHDSRTSIQTAFGEASSADASIKSKSMNSSNHNLCVATSPSSVKSRQNSRQNSIKSRSSTAALAAARAAEFRSNNISRGNTPLLAATPASQMRRSTGRQRAENNDPNEQNTIEKGAK